jgi:predicted dehydrogenase
MSGPSVGPANGRPVGVGIIGGGLMGRELASALARFFVMEGIPDRPQLVAVCDKNPAALDWFRRVPTISTFTDDHQVLLKDPRVDVVYAAVPHDLHQRIYIDTLEAGKDLLGEKPFGIDHRAALAIQEAASRAGRFVRCSSEFPFMPAMNRAFDIVRSGKLGRLFEVQAGFLHASDLDPKKPINWKRQAKHCGAIGVMGDLGMHAMHVPLKLGWKPVRVHAQLQKIYPQRPDGQGGMAPCDTWDNATLNTDIVVDGEEVPMRIELKRLSPGDTNSWYFTALGTDGGVRYCTREPKTLWIFERLADASQSCWRRLDMGHETGFATSTGKIFEAGFPDCFLQMWGAFIAERAGVLGDRLGCARIEDAVLAHRLFAAGLESHQEKRVVSL